jgi:hypothetical protein
MHNLPFAEDYIEGGVVQNLYPTERINDAADAREVEERDVIYGNACGASHPRRQTRD